MPSKSTKHPFTYRVEPDDSHRTFTFYAPDQPTADRYAKDWARRHNLTRLVRLKRGT